MLDQSKQLNAELDAIIARLGSQLTISQEGSGTEVRMGFPLPRD